MSTYQTIMYSITITLSTTLGFLFALAWMGYRASEITRRIRKEIDELEKRIQVIKAMTKDIDEDERQVGR